MIQAVVLILLTVGTQLFAPEPLLSAVYNYDHTRSFARELLDSRLPYDLAYSTWIHTLYKSHDQSDRNLAEKLAKDSLGAEALQKRLGSLEQRTKHTHMDSVRLQALSIALQRQERLTRQNTEESPNKEHPAQPSRPKSGKKRSPGPSGEGLRRACRQSKTS